jgi:hypothetical protein
MTRKSSIVIPSSSMTGPGWSPEEVIVESGAQVRAPGALDAGKKSPDSGRIRTRSNVVLLNELEREGP